MDLFEYMRQSNKEKESPLAARLRPTTLEEVVGQKHIIGKDKLLYRAIKADKISSLIFYGPPGTGKTTLAKVIAGTTSSEFVQINATVAGKKDMEEVISKAKDNQGMYGKKTILFITHDVEEALFLSSSVLVVEDTPIRSLREIPVPMGYPRTRQDLVRSDIVQLREDLVDMLRKQVTE